MKLLQWVLYSEKQKTFVKDTSRGILRMYHSVSSAEIGSSSPLIGRLAHQEAEFLGFKLVLVDKL